MADGLDPATMDALNQLGAEIEAQAVAEGAQTPPETPAQAETPAVEEAAPEPPEGQEQAAEGEGEVGEGAEDEDGSAGDKPKPAKATGADKRIKELTREKYEARNRAEQEKARREALERELAELRASQQRQPDPAQAAAPPTGQTQQPPVIQNRGETGQDFEVRVQAEAERRSKAAAFDAACNRVATKGIETHKDFTEAQGALIGAFGRQVNMRPEFLQAIVRLENGHDVFHHLGTNLEAAEALFNHAEPVDLVMAMGELSANLKTPKVQKISNAPAPVNPLRGGGGNRAVRLEDENLSADAYKEQLFKAMAS